MYEEFFTPEYQGEGAQNIPLVDNFLVSAVCQSSVQLLSWSLHAIDWQTAVGEVAWPLVIL